MSTNLLTKRKTIGLYFKDDTGKVEVAAQQAGGLAFHGRRHLMGKRDGYTITHVASGFSVPTAVALPSARVARHVMNALLSLPGVDWTRSADELHAELGLAGRVSNCVYEALKTAP